jgi:hypothetical protein
MPMMRVVMIGAVGVVMTVVGVHRGECSKLKVARLMLVLQDRVKL